METLLDHGITLAELHQFEAYEDWDSLDIYKENVSYFEDIPYNYDFCYKQIAELYALRGDSAKVAEYRAKIQDRSILDPYRWYDWAGTGQPSDHQVAPEAQRKAA